MLAVGAVQWGGAWHIDEPFFLAIARQILRDPAHPLAFVFNWYGRAVPMAELNNTPPLFPYALAAALKISGGGEFWTRALFFPCDLAAAWSLLALAGRFIKRPLWPTLIVLAGPGFALNLPHLMAERLMFAFAFPALYFGVRWAEEGGVWGVTSALLAAAAVATKYNAVFLLPPVLIYARRRGASYSALAAWTATALFGVGAYQLAHWRESAAAASTVASAAASGIWSTPAHKVRSLLAFVGGLSLFIPFAARRLRPPVSAVLVAAALCAWLFAPWNDLAPLVTVIDRATGFLLAWGLSVAVSSLTAGPRTRGAALWATWAGAAAVLQIMYWSVLARFAVLIVVPLTFWFWERLEADGRAPSARGAAFALGAIVLMTSALGRVDRTYADAQKAAAEETWPAGTLWCAGHWGLQEYMTARGARELDLGSGGWDAVRPGDRVVVPKVNTNVMRPARPLRASTSTRTVDSWIPLRLISGWKGEGGFYSNVSGFLPWSISTEPVETITFVDAL